MFYYLCNLLSIIAEFMQIFINLLQIVVELSFPYFLSKKTFDIFLNFKIYNTQAGFFEPKKTKYCFYYDLCKIYEK